MGARETVLVYRAAALTPLTLFCGAGLRPCRRASARRGFTSKASPLADFQFLDTPRDNAEVAGIYISWPFCAQKCTYCNFASGVQPRGLEQDYLTALTSEISSQMPSISTPDTLYIGGGTPSAIDPPIIERVLAALPHQWREATIEAAPGTLTPERIRAWRSFGVNRVSLGVQSFIRTELARTGRKHDATIVENDVALLIA
jgi:coproporphyrinogen III oxidase-like Fe-S oxidoreductase